jgi:ligand-binding SRPBCC domain-containing protein
MKTFDYEFEIKAPLSAVSEFHHDTSVLKKLTPPPIFIQLHHFEPLADGSTAELTMWFGPFPVLWTAVHSNVSAQGFTDTQHRGPLKHWQHTHRFITITDRQTLVKEHIEYEYKAGLRGFLSRLLFNRASLFFLFTARKWLTRRHIGRHSRRFKESNLSPISAGEKPTPNP